MVLTWLFSRLIGLFVKDDLTKVFEEFFYNGRIASSMNFTFITLEPKVLFYKDT